jgi:hypothetical protein
MTKCNSFPIGFTAFTIDRIMTSSRQQSHGLCTMLASALQRFARPASRVAYGGQSAMLVVGCHTSRSANHQLRARLSSLPQRAFVSTMGGRPNLGSATAAGARVLWSRLAVASWTGPRGARWASRSEAEYAAPCMPTTCKRCALKLYTVSLLITHFHFTSVVCLDCVSRPLVDPDRRTAHVHVWLPVDFHKSERFCSQSSFLSLV